MTRAAIIDPTRFTVDYVNIIEYKLVDEMFIKLANGDLCPAAYIFPENEFEFLVETMNKLAKAKKEYDDYQAEVFYQILPKHRTWRKL